MRAMMRIKLPLVLAVAAQALGAQQKRPITFEDFASVRAVSDPQPAPDGRTVLYAVRTTDVAANRRTSQTFAVPAEGGTARVFPEAGVSATEARWSPDGRYVAFIAGDQLWVSDAAGANRRQLTSLNGGATGPVWSSASDQIVFVSSVYPDCATDACNAAKDKAKADSKV